MAAGGRQARGMDLEAFRETWREEIARRQPEFGLDLPDVSLPGVDQHHVRATLIYMHATELEGKADYNKAIRLYRRAFKLCPLLTQRDLDSLSHRITERLSAQQQQLAAGKGKVEREREGGGGRGGRGEGDGGGEQAHPPRLVGPDAAPRDRGGNPGRPAESHRSRVLPSEQLDKSFVHRASPPTVAPALHVADTHIGDLPPDALFLVLSFLDAVSVEMCASVCVRLHWLCREAHLWERFCKQVWGADAEDARERERKSWRGLFVSRPHLHFDGIYVCRTSYIRSGVVQWGQSYDPVHLCRYFRYIRFYPNNKVCAVVSNVEPSQFLPVHKNTLHRAKDVRSGTYSVQGTDVTLALPHSDGRTRFVYRLAITTTAKARQCLRWRGIQSVTLPSSEPVQMSHETEGTLFFVRAV